MPSTCLCPETSLVGPQGQSDSEVGTAWWLAWGPLAGIHGWTELTYPQNSHTFWQPCLGASEWLRLSVAPPASAAEGGHRSTGALCF